MIPLVLETIVRTLGTGSFRWVDDQPTDDDLDHIFKQTSDQFDRLELKDSMLRDLRAGKASLVTKSSEYAKVLAIVYPDTEIPWDMFAQIFTAFGKPSKPSRGSWRIVWFAHPSLRTRPDGTEPGPEHVNGGYTYACTNDTIVIYREEEVCRVLVHELLHAACTDHEGLSEVDNEALTETWAELFLVGIQAKGSLQKAESLWKAQAQWIADQEDVLRRENKVNDRQSYAWRYTVARRAVLHGFGITLPHPSASPSVGTSMRFTHAGI